MFLSKLALQNFRSYKQSTFDFSSDTTVIVGPNTAGKTNIVEGVTLLSSGKSFRTDKDTQMIRLGQEMGRVQASIIQNNNEKEKMKLEVVLVQGEATGGRFTKKFLVNGVPKRRVDFVGHVPTVLFSPEELDIIVDGPSVRRIFLDNILEQTDREYRFAHSTYDKALRQRNALLQLVKETGRKNKEQFVYWDGLLIENGTYITKQREVFLEFVNTTKKDVFQFQTVYDKSTISKERLQQYADAEIAAGVTLVGPQRDDFFLLMKNPQEQNIQHFGSRGQQRLTVLQLKLLEILYLESVLQQNPLLVLDDLFSELDEDHIKLVLGKVTGQQVIMTTTHEEFVDKKVLKKCSIIEL